jgi:hypothetical protein
MPFLAAMMRSPARADELFFHDKDDHLALDSISRPQRIYRLARSALIAEFVPAGRRADPDPFRTDAGDPRTF